jgi:hypothetical protein
VILRRTVIHISGACDRASPRSETTPLRLQLGADAVASVRAHADQLLNDLSAWEKISIDTRVDTVTGLKLSEIKNPWRPT